MDFKRIVIEKSADACGFVVLIDGKWLADGLSPDECLGCIASAIYRESKAAQFVRPIPMLTRHGMDLFEREGKHQWPMTRPRSSRVGASRS